jgi:hypothetical protein
MKALRTTVGLTLACGLAIGGATAAAQQDGTGRRYEKGATVTLQGCVVAAEKKDTYVLTGVREWPAGSSEMGKHGQRMYWIDKGSKEMKDHLGQTIQLTGKITDVEKSEMEIKPGESNNGLMVEIEGPGRDVITPAANAGVTATNRPNRDDVPITLLKLKIDDVKTTGDTCPTIR